MRYERGSFIVVPSREKLRGMPVPAQALYMWLCAYANETGECYPSRETLAQDCDCSKDTIDRMTKLLLERGLIEVENRVKNGEKQTNLYTVVIWGGSRTQRLPSRTSRQGVAAISGIELNPVLTQTTEGGGDFAPLPLKEVKEIREEDEDPIGTFDRQEARVIPKPYSPKSTKEAWKNGERRLQILEWFFTEKDLWEKMPTEVKLKAFMKRHSEAAKRLAKQDWKKSELSNAKSKAMFSPEMEEEWTLETIEKYLTK